MRRRDVWTSFVASLAGTVLPWRSARAQQPDPRRSARPDPEREAGVAPVNPEFPLGDLRRYGAVGNGIADDSVAWQQAINVGIVLVPPRHSFRIVTPASRKGTVVIQGSGPTSKLLCDGSLLTVLEGTDSLLDNFCMENITAPWIVVRRPGVAGAVLQRSNSVPGYQPTVNDNDIWERLNPEQRNQQIGPVISFSGNAAHIQLSRICGRFVSLIVNDAVNSVVRDCSFRAGKNHHANGGIYFNNYSNQIGSGNQAINNNVQYGSFCGIAFNNNRDFTVCANICAYNGESGIKTMQYDGVHPNAQSYRGVITNNKCFRNHYDGLDLMSLFPQAADGSKDTTFSCHTVSGNQSYENDGTGMNADGRGNSYVGNSFIRNRAFGFWGSGVSFSQVHANLCIDNNQGRDPGHPEMLISGRSGGNSITANRVCSGGGNNSAAIMTRQGNSAAPNHISGNYASGSAFRFGGSGSAPSVELNNITDPHSL